MGRRQSTVAGVARMTVQAFGGCQGCGERSLRSVIDLGHQPPVHAMLRTDQLDLPETTYPLQLVRCVACGLVQLRHLLDPRIVFPVEYPYRSGLTAPMIADFEELAEQAIEEHGLAVGDLVVDIGSNDGTLLRVFQDRGMRVVGVEPTDVASLATRAGIPTTQAYFDRSVALQIRKAHGPARLVTATNVIGHIPDIVDVFRSIASMLAENGVFVSESHYLRDLLDGLQYDTIYHEHLRYYSLRPFARIAQLANTTAFDARRIQTHGGSLRVWVAPGSRPVTDRFRTLLEEEQSASLYDEGTYELFRERTQDHRRKLLSLLLSLRHDGARLAGAGAPARASTLLNYCHVDADMLLFIREQDSSPKVGLHMPMSHIPIVGEDALIQQQPDYTVVLSWHIAEVVIESIREKGYRGKFIIPLAEPRVVA